MWRGLEQQAVGLGPVLEQERGAELRAADLVEPLRGAALAVEHRADKVPTPARSRAAELFSAEQEQAHPEAAGHEEAVLEAWVLVAPAA